MVKNEIVVSSYLENLAWTEFWKAGNEATKTLPDSKLTIYRAGENVPNRGREAGQWLHHIVANYDNLAEFTFFVQADLGASYGKKMDLWPHDLNAFRGFRPPPGNGFYIWPSFIPVLEAENPIAAGQHGYSMADCVNIEALWGEGPQRFSWPKIFPMAFLGAQHVVSSDVIKALPLEYYQKALELADDPFAWWLEYGKWPAVIYDIFRQGPLKQKV